MYSIEVLVKRNIEAAARECAHADADGDWALANAIDNTALRILEDTSLLRLFNEAYERAQTAIKDQPQPDPEPEADGPEDEGEGNLWETIVASGLRRQQDGGAR